MLKMFIISLLFSGQLMASESRCLSDITLFVEATDKKLPDLVFQNSNAQLLDSFKAILKTTEKDFSGLNGMSKLNAQIFIVGDKLSLGFKRFYPKLPAAVLDEVSLRLQKIFIGEFGLSWSEHAKLLKNNLLPSELNSELFISIPEILSKHVNIDNRFDIPTIAGYSKDVPWTVFLDRDLPQKTADGMMVLFPLLLHETVEKILIETAGLDERIYFRTHQIAQRMEKAWVKEAGYSWQKWQHGDISLFGKMVENKKLIHVAPNLDGLPYLEAKMLESWSTILQSYNMAKELFTPRMVAPRVLHLEFNDQVAMGEAVFRFQEYFESPKFKDKIFTRDEFKEWYYKEKNTSEFTYTEVDAFNFPSKILKPFFAGKFDALDPAEKSMLDIFAHMPENFYVTLSVKGGDPDGFEHEMSHALYFLDKEYHDRVNAVLVKYDLRPLQQFIVKTWGNYHDDVLQDEAHAWLLHNEKDLREAGFPTDSLLEMRQELQAIYKEKKYR
jgi:hypothetical protein